MIHSSLMAFVDCNQLLQQLELRGSIEQIPATVDCIQCDRHALRLLPDNRHGGIWSYCASCGFAGDIIELAAARWKADIDQAASVAVDSRYLPSIQHTVDLYLERQRRHAAVRALWQRCVDDVRCATSSQTVALTNFNIHVNRHVSWNTCASPLVGVASTATLRQLADSLDTAMPNANETACWVVQPIGTMPGRIDGFVAASSLKTSVTIAPRRTRSRVTVAAGLVATNSGTILVLDDPWTTLSMQLQHLRTHDYLLPLICVTDANRRTAQELRRTHRCQFAVGTVSRSIALPAITASLGDGLVAGRLDTDGILAKSAPASIVQRAINRAMSLASYVTMHAAEIQPEDLQHIIRNTNDPRTRVNICRISHPNVQSAVHACEQADHVDQIVVHDHRLWLNGVAITNGVPVFTRVVSTGSHQTSQFFGEVRFKDHVSQFSVTGKKSITGPLGRIANQVTDFWYKTRHARKIYEFTRRTFRPIEVRGVARVGWNDIRQEMQFPLFVINTSGAITVAVPVGDLPHVSQRSTSLSVSRQLEPLIANTHSTKLGWLAASYISHSMLSAANQQPITKIASLGSSFVRVMQSAGCRTWHNSTADDWPSVIATHQYRDDRNLLQTVNRPVFIHADSMTGHVLATQGWTLVDTGDANIPTSVGLAASVAAVEFICHEVQTNQLRMNAGTIYDTYLRLRNWARRYITLPNVNHLSGTLKSLSGRNSWLGSLLCIQYALEHDLLNPTAFVGGVELKDNVLHVPQRQLEAAASRYGFVPLSIDQMTDSLKTAVGMKGIRYEPGQEYWLLDYDWFKESTAWTPTPDKPKNS